MREADRELGLAGAADSPAARRGRPPSGSPPRRHEQVVSPGRQLVGQPEPGLLARGRSRASGGTDPVRTSASCAAQPCSLSLPHAKRCRGHLTGAIPEPHVAAEIAANAELTAFRTATADQLIELASIFTAALTAQHPSHREDPSTARSAGWSATTVADPGATSVNPPSVTTGSPLASSSAHCSLRRSAPQGQNQDLSTRNGPWRQLPPRQLRPVPGLRHGLSRRHRQIRVQPEHRRPPAASAGGPGSSKSVPDTCSLARSAGQSSTGTGGYTRISADPLHHRDPGQRARPLPGRPARPPDDLPDPRVLPGPRGRRPFPVRLGHPGSDRNSAPPGPPPPARRSGPAAWPAQPG